MPGFSDIAQDEFAFLEREFQYRVVAAKDDRDGGEVTYVNRKAGVGVKVLYEFRSAFVFVFIYRLVHGECRDNPRRIDSSTEITCFDFNDYLDDDMTMKPAYEYDEKSPYFDAKNGLRNFTREFAKRLRTEGRAILQGDLTMPPAMATIIRNRADTSKDS